MIINPVSVQFLQVLLVLSNILRNEYSCKKTYKITDGIYIRDVYQAISGQLGYIKDFIPWQIKASLVRQ